MKIAVIIGVIHMTLGVCLKALNDIYFKNYKEVIFVFTSQFLFLLGLFGYMDLLIIYKWLVPWGV
jgi:V-type H+-transporting ATPase subunit a